MPKLEEVDGAHGDMDAERKELMRLMETAKNDDRKAIIRDSLINLEQTDKALSPNKRLGGSAALLASRHTNIFNTEKIASETVFLKSPPVRPMSARIRRPSINNLDVIQEEKKLSMSLEKVLGIEDKSIVDVRLDDIYEICSSCYDPRLSHWDPFSKSSSSRWISTGMMPQFLSIGLKVNWFIMEVDITAIGVKSVSISIEGSLSKIPLKKVNSTTFSFSTKVPVDQGGVKPHKARGNKVIIIMDESTEDFVIVDSIRIRAAPTG